MTPAPPSSTTPPATASAMSVAGCRLPPAPVFGAAALPVAVPAACDVVGAVATVTVVDGVVAVVATHTTTTVVVFCCVFTVNWCGACRWNLPAVFGVHCPARANWPLPALLGDQLSGTLPLEGPDSPSGADEAIGVADVHCDPVKAELLFMAPGVEDSERLSGVPTMPCPV